MGEEKRIISWPDYQVLIDDNGYCAECIEFLKDKDNKCEPVCPHWQKLEVPAVVKTCVVCEDKFVPLYGGQEMCLPCQKDSI